MTFKEYNERKDALLEQMRLLDEEYKSHSPFKVGDKVIATNRGKDVECFIGEIKIPYSHNSRGYEYEYKAAKKDGTMSERGAGVYYPSVIRHA